MHTNTVGTPNNRCMGAKMYTSTTTLMWRKAIIRQCNELPAKNHRNTRGNWGTANCNQWLPTFAISSSRHPIQSQVSCNIFKRRFIHSAMTRKIMAKSSTSGTVFIPIKSMNNISVLTALSHILQHQKH